MDCLTPEQLELLARDALGLIEAERLRGHVGRCPECHRKLGECLAHEELARKLRRAGAGDLLERLTGSADERTAMGVPETRTVEDSNATLSTPVASDVLPPVDDFPGYDILDEISRGGQGVVYRALQHGTKREVAIKVLREGFYASQAAKHRFEREIEVVGQLSHANIVTIFQPGRTKGGLHYYVMDYVPGLPLDRYVHRERLALEDVLKLVVTICEAVQYAHQRGFVHRDLKPSNILVDDQGRPKILDFGLARHISVADTDLTSEGQVLGTLPYMSPEQARGDQENINTLTDIYALGVMLYQVLAGRFPYPVEGTQFQVLHNITHTPPTSLFRAWSPESGVRLRYARRRSKRCPIDGDVETIVLKSLQKEQSRRYQSAGELARDIRHYLAGEPIEARRDSTWYVLSKVARRHRAATAVIVCVFAIAISSTFISLYFYRDARRALAAKTAGDQRLAEQLRTFEADHEAIGATMHGLSLGLFLREWEAGRLESARQIMTRMPAHLPERAAMRFLLDPNILPEELLTQMPAGADKLAYFVAGERARRKGRAEDAKRWYESCVNSAESGKIIEAAKARLEQLAAGDAGTQPAAVSDPDPGE